MEKAVLSNRIYFRPESKGATKDIMNALTYRIEGKINPKTKLRPVEIIKNYKIFSNGLISIPQGRLDLVPSYYEIEDKRVTNSMPFPSTAFPLRESQQPVYDEVDDTCMINALVGWGKTVTALYIAKKLEQKTLVVTHTTAIRDHWIKQIEELFNWHPGVIGSGIYDIHDQFIVVGNVQTVTKHVPALSKEFGLVILDEAHHVPATTFASIIDGMYSRYRIGLSGTLNRTDGKHILFKDYFGDKIYKPPQSHTLNPTIRLVPTGLFLPQSQTWTQKINSLLYDEDYQKFVAALAITQINKGHRVLVVADRIEFLNKVKEYIGPTCVLITGETTSEDRKNRIEEVEKGKKMCIAGSRQIFSEGISVNILSCVILAVPTSNPIILEQVIGRIMRLHPDKLSPEVYDLQFSSPAERKQNSARLAFYASKGWEVQKV